MSPDPSAADPPFADPRRPAWPITAGTPSATVPAGPPRRRLGTAWLLLAVVIGILAGLGTKAPCLTSYEWTPGQSAVNWNDYRQYSLACYSDTIPLYGLERLADGDLPYRSSWTDEPGGQARYMEYPVVTGMLQYGAMRITKAVLPWTDELPGPGTAGPPEVVVYFLVMALLLALFWVAAVWATARLCGPRPRDVLLVALSPLVAVHLFTNFDPLAVACAMVGLLAWTKRRPALAGVLLGIGAAAKLYPLLLLGPLLVLGWRAGRSRPAWTALGTATAAWLLVNAPFALLYPRGWWEFFRLNSERPADHDSIYFAVQTLTGWPGFDPGLAAGAAPRILNLVSLAAFAVACLLVAAVAVLAPRRPRVAALAFLVVSAFLLTNKVWSPQYSLWLVPLAVLALGRPRLVLAWMVVDAAVWYPRMAYFLHLVDEDRGWPTEVFVTAVCLRDAFVLLLCAVVLHDVFRPQRDPVRRAGADDPCGGPLDGAPDRRGRGRPALPAAPVPADAQDPAVGSPM